MEITSYQSNRDELILLYHRFKSKGYRLRVPAHIFMSLDELENREVFVKPGFLVMGDPLTDMTPRLITVEQLMTLIKRLNNETHIGFHYPDEAVTMYEDIRRYLDLWMTMANLAPQFPIPDLAELYELEDLMVWLFKIYRPLVMAEQYRKARALDQKIAKTNNPLSAWLALADGMGPEEVNPTFVSILDTQLPERLRNHYEATKNAQTREWLFDDL